MIMLSILLIFILASCKGDDDHSDDHEDDDHEDDDHEADDHSDDHEDDDHDDDHSHDHDDDHDHDHDHEINTDPSGEEVRNALLLSMFAGMSTVIGAASAFCIGIDDAKKERSTFLAGCLSFAAAVMLYVSFVEIWPEAIEKFEEGEDEQIAHIFTSLTFFSGIFLGFCTSKCVHMFQDRNPASKTSEDRAVEMQSGNKNGKEGEEPSVEILSTPVQKVELLKTGIVTAISIAVHNFPEGLLTFFAAISDWDLGVATAFAIAVHNIPEGISIAVPYYYASEQRWKAFALAFVSGLAEPFGALIGWAILGDIWGDSVFAIMFGFTAGIMVYVSLSQLLPLARNNDPEDKVTTIMLYIGMFVMDLSLYVGGKHSH